MKPAAKNRRRLSVISWLTCGALAVVAVLLIGNRMIQQRAAESAASIVRIQSEADPVMRASLNLDAAVGEFENAMTSILQAPSQADDLQQVRGMSALHEAQDALQTARNGLQGRHLSPRLNSLLDALSGEAEVLVRLETTRRQSLRNYSRSIASLAERVRVAGGNGIWVGEQNIARRSLTDLAAAVNAIRAAAVADGPVPLDRPSRALTRAEQQFEATLRLHAAELTRSPGVVWLEMLRESLSRARNARNAAQNHRVLIEQARSTFQQLRDEIDVSVRAELAEPARRKMAEGPLRAEQIVRESNDAVARVSFSALAIVLLVFAITGYAIAAPLRRLREATRHLAAGSLATRVATGGPRELDELARSFNTMADELGKAESELQADRSLLEERVVRRTSELRHLAMHDPLTGLPNRRQLFEEVNAAIDVATGLGTRVALLIIDLDDFKTSNDSLGHAFGDRLLQAVAAHLLQDFGKEALISRLGGDEFTIFKAQVASAREVDELADRVVASFQRPIRIDERELLISASVGFAMAPEHGSDTESLLRSADAALFRAKALGRNRHHAYSPSLLVANDTKFQTEQALRRAISDGALLLHFQPEVSLSTRQVTVAEALLRWRRADGTIASAAEFIGIAAETDLISQLNIWALDHALATVVEQRAGMWPDMRVAVNVSSRQFRHAGFIAQLEASLNRYGLAPDCLEIELTEDVLQTGPGTMESLKALRAMGITIALDDFGAGFSSLASIEQLPLSRIKLDRSLIAAIDANERSAAIVTSVIRLCHDLGLSVTAEGVERPAQLALLAALGGVDVQGYLIARPQPVDELVAQLSQLRGRIQSPAGVGGGLLIPSGVAEDPSVALLRGPSERTNRR